ncbi:FAD-dependent oxidoreductase, partial [Stenotrophomonas maltophilia]|uniref:FAD-dependent oxidoreductase n=3 Tax=Pseudomonadota TaxID=1224 RepID=UPI0013DA31CC
PVEDKDVSTHLEKQFKKQGMNIRTSTGVDKIEATGSGVKASIKDKDGKTTVEEFSHVIVAIGIVPNTENIG